MRARCLSSTVLLSLVLVSCAHAQPSTPSPGPDFIAVGDGWVHKDGVAIAPLPDAPPLITTVEGCIAAQPAGSTPLDHLQACSHLIGVSIPGCEQVNAYTDPDRAVWCSEQSMAANPTRPQPRAFVLGAVYSRPYGERKILIIGKALGLDGVEVVTAQVVHPASERGVPVAFVNDGGVDAQQ